VPHEIQDEKSTARAANIPNQFGEFARREVMNYHHRDGHIGFGEWLPYSIRAEDRKVGVFAWRLQIDPDDLDSELLLNVAQQRAVRAPDVKDSPYGLGVTPYAPDHGASVTDPPVHTRKVAIASFTNVFGDARIVQNLRFE